MLKRRLYLQIYGILLFSLAAVVLTFAILGYVFRPDGDNQRLGETFARLLIHSAPEKSLSQEEQQRAIDKLGRDLNLSVTLLDETRISVANYGPLQTLPRTFKKRKRWRYRLPDGGWVIPLPDERWLLIDGITPRPLRPFARFWLVLATIALAVGAFSYPFVKKLTRRLEALRHNVEMIGSGDLKARVAVEGKDEVAALASSFNAAAQKIEGLLNAQKMLLANASHELRTPLSRIRLGIEMLDNEQNANRLNNLRNDVAELDELIDEILLMSRLDTGSNIMLENDVDVVALIAEEAARFDACRFTGSAPAMKADRRLLARLIRNLLQNAEIHGAPPISVDLETKDNHVIITVKDSGTGFPEDGAERLFKAFQRGADRQNVSGYGLGLALVQQIAEAHSGYAEIVAKDKARSAVRVVFPLTAMRFTHQSNAPPHQALPLEPDTR